MAFRFRAAAMAPFGPQRRSSAEGRSSVQRKRRRLRALTVGVLAFAPARTPQDNPLPPRGRQRDSVSARPGDFPRRLWHRLKLPSAAQKSGILRRPSSDPTTNEPSASANSGPNTCPSSDKSTGRYALTEDYSHTVKLLTLTINRLVVSGVRTRRLPRLPVEPVAMSCPCRCCPGRTRVSHRRTDRRWR